MFQERVSAFIASFGEHLAGLTPAQHANVVESLRVAKIEPKKTLRKECGQLAPLALLMAAT